MPPDLSKNTRSQADGRTPARPGIGYPTDLDQWQPLVWYVVNRVRCTLPACVSEEDLFSAGMVGLMVAARSYDPSRGAEFKTYAYHRIRGAILDELRRLDFLPRSQREKARQTGKEPPSMVSIPTDEDGQESLEAAAEEHPCEQEDMQDALERRLADLPPKMRDVMILYYREGYRMREIGATMGLTESRVSQIHSNALALLRRKLGRAAGDLE